MIPFSAEDGSGKEGVILEDIAGEDLCWFVNVVERICPKTCKRDETG